MPKAEVSTKLCYGTTRTRMQDSLSLISLFRLSVFEIDIVDRSLSLVCPPRSKETLSLSLLCSTNVEP
jgi:hypothetical protein